MPYSAFSWTVSCLSAGIAGRPLCGVFPSDIDENSFCEWVDGQSIGPALYPLLKDQRAAPEGIVRHTRERYRSAALYIDYARQVLQELHPAFSRLGRVALVQGMALLECAYPEGAVRPMGDVDLYLPDAPPDKIAPVLESQGFERWLHYQNVWVRGGFFLDIHDCFWGETRISQRRWLAPSQSVPLVASALCQGYYVPEKGLALAHALFHACKHGFSRLVWDLDMVLLLRQLTGEAISLQWPSGNFAPLLNERIRHVWGRSLSPVVALPGTLSFLKKQGFRWVFKHGGREGAGEFALALFVPGVLRSLMYLVQAALPSRNVLSEMYGPKPFVCLLFIRMADFIRIALGRPKPAALS